MASETHSAARRVAVLGGGAWGRALAVAARRAVAEVKVWARDPETTAARADFPVSSSIEDVAAEADLVLVATPAQTIRSVLEVCGPAIPRATPIAIGAKGIERGSLQLMSEVAQQAAPDHPIGVVSGPSFAAEVVAERPTAVVAACADLEIARYIQNSLASRAFRPYASDDVMGVDVGGALKNVLAIACGIVAGKGLGDNPRAALITRGLAEIARLAAARGARMETVMGLSGLGDLVLTAGSLQSRNMALGHALGRGVALQDLIGSDKALAEGVWTAQAAVALAERYGVSLPICEAVHAIVDRGAEIDAVIDDLLSRPLGRE